VIVRLTVKQRKMIEEITLQSKLAAPFRQPLQEWFERDVQVASKHRYDIAMPAAAWRVVAESLFDYCYDSRGFRARRLRVSEINALKAVRSSLNVREAHPALSGIGAIGMIPELIPAWTNENRFSPYPLPHESFLVLAPTTIKLGSRRVATKWIATDGPVRGPVLDPDEHWRFVTVP